MAKFISITRKVCITLLILLPVAAFAHYMIFPQETRSILIGYSSFKKDGRLYYNDRTEQHKIDSLKVLITAASARVDSFWGERTSAPKFIYCDDQKDYEKYSIAPFAPAVTYIKLGAVIVLSADGADLDIIAHEISHAALYERIGFYAFNYSIPAWFKHGLAMQNDRRDYYSEDTLKVRTDNFRNMPDVKALRTDVQFYSGTHSQVMLHYMAAKHVVSNWYTREKLARLVSDLEAGRSFDASFGK